jgi:hypothetical protein
MPNIPIAVPLEILNHLLKYAVYSFQEFKRDYLTLHRMGFLLGIYSLIGIKGLTDYHPHLLMTQTDEDECLEAHVEKWKDRKFHRMWDHVQDIVSLVNEFDRIVAGLFIKKRDDHVKPGASGTQTPEKPPTTASREAESGRACSSQSEKGPWGYSA